MKFINIKNIIFIIIALTFSYACMASENRRRHPLIPRSGVIQYAGSIGFISVGAEWEYGKREQWATTLMIGYIPKRHSNRPKAAITLKQTYSPWNIVINGNINLRPLNCGLFLNTIYSHKFWTKEPGKYPEGYYQISTRVRPHIFIGQEIEFKAKKLKDKFIKSISLYYEFNSCDIYLCSYFPNMKYLSPADIFALGIGMKLNF